MADPGFPKGGFNTKEPTYYSAKFPRKLQKKMKTIGRGAHIKFYYVDLPRLNVRIPLIRLYFFFKL